MHMARVPHATRSNVIQMLIVMFHLLRITRQTTTTKQIAGTKSTERIFFFH